jgi:hypothetical protein
VPHGDEPEQSEELNSLWATIGGVIKYFRFSYDYVLYEISYCNLMMLLCTIPQYKKQEEKDKPKAKGNVIELDSFEDFMNLNIE